MPTRSVAKRGHKTRKEWAAECRGWQQKTVEGLIGLGKTLINAKRDLDQHGAWLPMLRDDLKMDIRFAQCVMKLARNERFSKASNLSLLPHALSALVEIARLSDDDFEAGKKSGAINPSTTAKQARTFVTVKVTHRAHKFACVSYARPTPAEECAKVVEYDPNETPSDGQEVAGSIGAPSDPLIADLAVIEEQLRARLEGDRRARALAGLEQIRKALVEPRAPDGPKTPPESAG
jgi:hypothetical protein